MKRLLLSLLVAWLALVAGVARGEEGITFNIKDAEIESVIETVAEYTGKNFVIDPRVRGKVTVISKTPLNKEQLFQLFLSILEVNNFTAVNGNGIYKVVPIDQAKQKPLNVAEAKDGETGEEIVTRVIQVVNVAPNDLVGLLRPLLPQQSHIAALPGTNTLVIADSARNIAKIVHIVELVDQKSSSEVEIVPLKNGSAVDVVRNLTELLGGGTGAPAANIARFAADERTNSVMISGTKPDRDYYRTLIKRLDSPQEASGNIHVVELKFAKAAELAKTLQSTIAKAVIEGTATASGTANGGSASFSATTRMPVSIEPDDVTNSLVITGPPAVFKALEPVIAALDVRRAQVMVEAIIAEVSQEKAMEFGIQWRSLPNGNAGVFAGTNFGGTGTNINSLSGVSSTGAANLASVGSGLSLGYLDASILGGEFLNLAALLRAMSSDANTNILATPSLMTLDNKEAQIVVAENVPFKTGEYTNTGASSSQVSPFQTIQREDVGLTLKITPRINAGDSLQLEIAQEISSLSNKASTTGAVDLITNKRSIQTNVIVDNGQTVVLGGLLDDTAQDTQEQVPLLGDIPVVGEAFKYRTKNRKKRNLMVFLRPTIVRDAHAAREIADARKPIARQAYTPPTGNDWQLATSNLSSRTPRAPKVDPNDAPLEPPDVIGDLIRSLNTGK